jgi:predicted nucleic acid-binding protein
VTDLVLDASAGVDLLLDTAAGRQLTTQLPQGATWWVPEHDYLEVGSTLRRAELSGTVDPTALARAIASLATAAFKRVQLRPLLLEAWTRRHNVTLADAFYVVLAEHLGATLVTTDLKLVASPGLSVPTIHAGGP